MAITINVQTNRVSGVAPLAVFFDAKGTTADGVTQPFGDLEYVWNFGDPGSGDWLYGAKADKESKNVERGPIAMHVFENPGSYTVELTVKDVNGLTATHQIEITVDDPDVVFAGTNTIAVSTGTDFTGAPPGSDHWTVATISDLSGPAITPNRRILLKRGDVWPTANLGLGNTGNGPIHLGCWGNPSDPPPYVNGSTIFVGGTDDNTSSDIRVTDIEGGGDPEVPGSGFQIAIRSGSNTLIQRVNLDFGTFVADPSLTNFFNLDLPDGLFIQDCSLEKAFGNLSYIGARRIAVVGCRYHNSTTDEHCARFPWADRMILAHCEFSLSDSPRHLLKLHAPIWDGSAYPNLPANEWSQYCNIRDVEWDAQGTTDWAVAIAPQNGAGDERLRQIIVEGCHFKGATSTAVLLFVASVELGFWARANILQRVSGGANTVGMQIGDRGANTVGTNRVRLFNNTWYSNNDVGPAIQLFQEGGGYSDILVANSLRVRMTLPTDPELTVVNDLQTTTPDFVVANPVNTEDFQLLETSPAINVGNAEFAAFVTVLGQEIDWGVGRPAVDLGATRDGTAPPPDPDPEPASISSCLFFGG